MTKRKQPFLLDCPFCGNKPMLYKVTLYAVLCENRKCPVKPQLIAASEKRAVLQWNTRH